MNKSPPLALDVLIFGGGMAGLWLLDELRRAGYHALLLESGALGAGQTIASQGIIHGGLKYTLSGLFTPSADAIREMPILWRDCLAGRREPDLRDTQVRAEYCHLWRTGDLRSRVGMIGARVGLRVAPTRIDRSDWPSALAGCPGDVFRLDEQVIDPASLLRNLAARNADALLCYGSGEFTIEHGSREAPATGPTIQLRASSTAAPDRVLSLRPASIVLAAGSGNQELRRRFGLEGEAMQLRPLHMAMLRGELPILNGHCADGARTRVTITSARDTAGRIVWQVGGQVAEDGVPIERAALIALARRELAATLPGLRFDHAEWSSYRVDRAEAAAGGKRPESIAMRREGSIITVWPTKLALAPRLADEVRASLPEPAVCNSATRATDAAALTAWRRPTVARPPWETETEWIAASSAAAV